MKMNSSQKEINKRKQAPAQLRYAPLGSLKYQPAKPVRCQASYALPVGRAFTQQLRWMVAPSRVLYQSARALLLYLLALRKTLQVRSLFDLPSAPLWAIKSDGAARPGGHPSPGKSPSALSVPSSRPAFRVFFYALALHPSNPFRMPLPARSCLPLPPTPGTKKAFMMLT